MSLLEVITKASSNIPTLPDEESDYPMVLNPEPFFAKLKTDNDGLQSIYPVKRVTGWEISDKDLISLGQKFCKKLKKKMKEERSLGKVGFLQMFASHLVNIGGHVGISVHPEKLDEEHVCKLVENLGAFMGRDVKGLILECCIALEVWGVLGCLISNGLVEHSFISYLVCKLLEKQKSDLIVLCVKHLSNLQTYDLMCILKYFLVVPGDGYRSLVSVREEWESQALLAIDTASRKGVDGKEKSMAMDAALLLMLAHDGFSVAELCLHYLIASTNVDDVIFPACVGKLNGGEITAFIQYLGKWLRKYQRFPQVGPCPNASSELGLKVCDWIPTLENVVKCLGFVVDEHFSSLVLHSEFLELRLLEEVANSLVAEARLCGALANLTGRLRIEPMSCREIGC